MSITGKIFIVVTTTEKVHQCGMQLFLGQEETQLLFFRRLGKRQANVTERLWNAPTYVHKIPSLQAHLNLRSWRTRRRASTPTWSRIRCTSAPGRSLCPSPRSCSRTSAPARSSCRAPRRQRALHSSNCKLYLLVPKIQNDCTVSV